MKLKPLLLACALSVAAVPTPAQAQVDADPSLTVGQVAFANSGKSVAQQPFLRGLGLLHNFEYDRAAQEFRRAQAADPGFAMAYWGEAMTHNHPVWMEQDAEAARAVLARLAPTAAERLAKAGTPRERLYLEAIEALYGEGSKEDRDRAYSARMQALSEKHPEDVDARSFYALSLLGLAHQGRDYALYMRSAGLLEEAFPDNRRHPGVLHYLIHSYDDPVHAPLGLRAARLYADVAPDAPHALHMTSHIFLAMGMWEDVVASNRASTAAANRLRAAAGRPATQCGHGNEWLVYGLYQLGRDREADAIVDGCRAQALAELARPGGPGAMEPVRSETLSYADMLARRVLETGDAPGAPLDIPQGTYLGSAFTLAYADLLAAGSDLARTRAAHARLKTLSAAFTQARANTVDVYPGVASRQSIILMQAAALEKLRANDGEGGLAELRRAAELEKSLPAEFGPPLVAKPSFELLGDELARLGRKAEAAEAYRSALALAPGRRLSLAGLRKLEAPVSVR